MVQLELDCIFWYSVNLLFFHTTPFHYWSWIKCFISLFPSLLWLFFFSFKFGVVYSLWLVEIIVSTFKYHLCQSSMIFKISFTRSSTKYWSFPEFYPWLIAFLLIYASHDFKSLLDKRLTLEPEGARFEYLTLLLLAAGQDAWSFSTWSFLSLHMKNCSLILANAWWLFYLETPFLYSLELFSTFLLHYSSILVGGTIFFPVMMPQEKKITWHIMN